MSRKVPLHYRVVVCHYGVLGQDRLRRLQELLNEEHEKGLRLVALSERPDQTGTLCVFEPDLMLDRS